MKDFLCVVTGVIGSIVASLFGGWSSALVTLLIFMAIDYASGLIVAGVFKNSSKTDNGTLDSKTCWKGLIRKGMTLVIVCVAHRLDVQFGTSYIQDAVIIAFMANELISLVENAGLMGVPIPSAITKAIEVLQDKSNNTEGE